MVTINEMSIRQLRSEARRVNLTGRGSKTRKEAIREALVAHRMANRGFGVPVKVAPLAPVNAYGPYARSLMEGNVRLDTAAKLRVANRTLTGLLVYMTTVAVAIWTIAQ